MAIEQSSPGGWLARSSPRQMTVEIERVVGLGAVFAAGAYIPGPGGVRSGVIVAAVLLPVWIGAMVRFKAGALLLALAGLAAVTGVVLTSVHAQDHHVWSSWALSRGLFVFGAVLTAGMLVWAVDIAGPAMVGVAFGAGLVAGIPFNLSDNPNLWRFTLSIPIGVFLLALAAWLRNVPISVAVAAGLAVVGTLNDSRSNSAMLAFAAVVVVWQSASSVSSSQRRGVGSVVMLCVTAWAIYLVGQAAIVEGYFGEITQARTQQQVERSGSLLLGGRPEIAASAALIGDYPLGMGAGTQPNLRDVLSAKARMTEIGYDPNNGYVESYMFGAGVEVHSMFGDLWLWFGLAGLALSVTMAGIMARGLVRMTRTRTLTVLYAYLAIRFVWDLAFSPATSSMRLLPLALALALTVAAKARDGTSTSAGFRRDAEPRQSVV